MVLPLKITGNKFEVAEFNEIRDRIQQGTADIKTQHLETTGNATITGTATVTGTLRVPRKSDPGSPLTGEIWVSVGAAKYRDNAGSPATQELEIISRKGVANGYASLDGSAKVPSAQISEVLALADLSDVSAKTGTGSVVVMDTSPTIVTPTIASFANATHNHQTAAGGGTLDHGSALVGLTDDDHTQYALLAGRSGGQTIIGGTAAGEDLVLQSTSHVTRGQIRLADDLELDDGKDIIIGGTNGTQIGQAGSKLSLFGAPVVAQQADFGVLTDGTGQTPDNTIENIPNPADAPVDADALREDLVANVLPPIERNISDLTDQVNQVRTVLRNLGLMA